MPASISRGSTLKIEPQECSSTFWPNPCAMSISRLKPGAEALNLAHTPYYAPIVGKVYDLRLERGDATLRVFVDGGLLLTAALPREDIPEDSHAYIGVSQVYSGVKIHGLSIESIADSQPALSDSGASR